MIISARISKIIPFPIPRQCHTHPEFGGICVVGYWHPNFHIVRRTPSLELCLAFHNVLHPRSPVTLNGGFDPDERFHWCGESVRHELKLAVGRYEGYRAVVLEAGETDALVKLDIFHFDSFTPRR